MKILSVFENLSDQGLLDHLWSLIGWLAGYPTISVDFDWL